MNKVKIFKYVIASIPILISFGALVISILGYCLSRRALKVNTEQYSIINRPRLDVKPKKYDDTGNYLEIVREKNYIIIKSLLIVENVGNIPAMNINLPDQIESPIVTKNKIKYEKPNQLSLNSGKIFYLNFPLKIEYSDEIEAEKALKNILDNINEGKWEGVTISAGLRYSNEIDQNLKYKTIFHFKINMDYMTVLDNRFITL